MFDKNEETKEKHLKQTISKCQEIFKEIESGNRMSQLGFDDNRNHKKMAEEKLNSINASTSLIPKMASNTDKKDVSKDIEGLTSKINNLTNLIIRSQKETTK